MGVAPSSAMLGEPEFDIPIVVNRKVERWLDYFQTVGRKHMVVWLARSERYIPMMQAILKEKGLPSDLVYLALIESGFSTYTSLPACAARIPISECVWFGVAIDMASMSSRSSSRRKSVMRSNLRP
jgi:hypothetical protein